MKATVIHALCILLALGQTYAQLTLDASRMPQAGDRYTTIRVDTTGVVEGDAGANRTWNFANVNLLQQQTDLHYVNANTTPFASEFPNATFASLVADVNPVYSYMTNAGNQLLSFGSRSCDHSLNYTNPMVMMQFPFTYNSSFSDVYGGTMAIDTSMQARSGGNVTAVGDGYGTIVLPGGEPYSALRVKSTRINHDTVEVPGFPLMVTTTTLTVYEWFITETKFPVFVLSCSQTAGPFGTSSLKFIEYHTPAATTVRQTWATIPSDVSLGQNFPNPFNPTTSIGFKIHSSGFVTLKVYNLIGQEVATLVSEELPGGIYVIPFDAKDVASGTYVYRLTTTQFSSTRMMTLVK